MASSCTSATDERPVDGEVGPPDLVREAADERAEGTDRIGDDQQVEEELERHVVVGQQQRRDRPLHVVEVVEHDRRQHDDGQVPEPRPCVGVLRGAVASRGRSPALAWGPVALALSSSSSIPFPAAAILAPDRPVLVGPARCYPGTRITMPGTRTGAVHGRAAPGSSRAGSRAGRRTARRHARHVGAEQLRHAVVAGPLEERMVQVGDGLQTQTSPLARGRGAGAARRGTSGAPRRVPHTNRTSTPHLTQALQGPDRAPRHQPPFHHPPARSRHVPTSHVLRRNQRHRTRQQGPGALPTSGDRRTPGTLRRSGRASLPSPPHRTIGKGRIDHADEPRPVRPTPSFDGVIGPRADADEDDAGRAPSAAAARRMSSMSSRRHAGSRAARFGPAARGCRRSR